MGTKKMNRRRNQSPPPASSGRQVTTRQGRRVLKQRYLLQKELGKGGMGQTFLAKDTHFGDMCVVKIVTGDYQLIQREARRLCYLKHEGIPAYRDFISESSASRADEPFLVQEYICGKTLKEAMVDSGGKMPEGEKTELLVTFRELGDWMTAREEV